MFMEYVLTERIDGEFMNVSKPYGYVVYIPTYRCNYRCYHCNLRYIPQRRNELTANEIKEVYQKSKTLNNLTVDISGGEPFLKEDIIEIVKNLTGLGHHLGITTNGSFPEKISKLIKQVENIDNINFAVSIDCMENIHDKLRGKNSFNRALESLKVLRDNNVNVSVNTTISDLNIDHLEQVKTFFSDFKVQHNFILQSMLISPEAYYDFDMKKIVHLLSKADIKLALSKGRFKIEDCHAGFTGCLIDPWGVVYTCLTRSAYYHSTKFIMGDLVEHNLDFDVLWESSQANDARNNVKSCIGCYGPCEITREIKCGTIDLRFSKEELNQLDVPSKITMGDNNSVFLEGDWYNLENWPPEIRWTGKKATAYLKDDNNCNKLFIRAFSSIQNMKGQILIDDKNIQIFEIGEGKWDILEVPLPTYCKNEIIKITIELEKIWIPDTFLKNCDTRELGIAVQKIWLECV